jgi:hypothetical protein
MLFTWMLTRIPRPSRQDVAARSERAPMNRAERRDLFRRYALGLTLIVLVYLLITILRSVRADFAPEIWSGLQQTVPPSIYAWSELVVAAGVLVLNGSMVLLHDNRRAFFTGLASAVFGVVLVGASLTALQYGALSPFVFMVLYGIGLYVPYLVVQTTLFERLIAMTRERGNIGYLVYLADSFGYLGYVGILLAHGSLARTEDFLAFFLTLSWVIVGACLILLAPCWYYLATHPATRTAGTPQAPLSDQRVVAERTI